MTVNFRYSINFYKKTYTTTIYLVPEHHWSASLSALDAADQAKKLYQCGMNFLSFFVKKCAQQKKYATKQGTVSY